MSIDYTPIRELTASQVEELRKHAQLTIQQFEARRSNRARFKNWEIKIWESAHKALDKPIPKLQSIHDY